MLARDGNCSGPHPPSRRGTPPGSRGASLKARPSPAASACCHGACCYGACCHLCLCRRREAARRADVKLGPVRRAPRGDHSSGIERYAIRAMWRPSSRVISFSDTQLTMLALNPLSLNPTPPLPAYPTPPLHTTTGRHPPGTRRVSPRRPLQPPIKPFARATQPDAEQVHSRSVNAVRSTNPTNEVRFTAATSPTFTYLLPARLPSHAASRVLRRPPTHGFVPHVSDVRAVPKLASSVRSVPQSCFAGHRPPPRAAYCAWAGHCPPALCPPVFFLLARTHFFSTNPHLLTHFALVHSALSTTPLSQRCPLCSCSLIPHSL